MLCCVSSETKRPPRRHDLLEKKQTRKMAECLLNDKKKLPTFWTVEARSPRPRGQTKRKK